MAHNAGIYFSQYTDTFRSKADIFGSLTIEMNEFFLLNFDDSPILKSFRDLPKNLKVVTDSKTYYIFDFVYQDLSVSTNPPIIDNQMTFHVEDEEIFSKIIDLLNCKKVYLSIKEYPLFHNMVKELAFYSLLQFLENAESRGIRGPSAVLEPFFGITNNDGIDEAGNVTSCNVIMNPLSLIDCLQSQPKNFSIVTKKRSYQCNKIAAAVSEVIMNSIQKDNTIESYFYDFLDENDEFQIICDFLNFQSIQITSENLNLLSKFASDLKFEMLLKIVTKINDMYSRCDTVLSNYQDEIDDVDELFEVLTTKNVSGCIEFIFQSKWISNDQLLKELLGSLVSLVYSSPKFIEKMAQVISALFERIKKNQEEKSELNEIVLKKSKKDLVQMITNQNPDSHVGPFIYELIKLNFFKLPIHGNEEEEDDSNLLLQCVTNQYVALWILPELERIVPSLQKFISSLVNNSGRFRLFTTFMKPEYMNDDWKLLRVMRDKKQSENPIAISIANDDIDQFQKLVYTLPDSQDQNMGTFYFRCLFNFKNETNKLTNTIPAFEFDLYSGRFYVDYAAFHGSVKCFKYLILNGAQVSSFTFDAAIEGGNIEIVHIVEQKLNEVCDDSYYNEKAVSTNSYNNNYSLDCSVFPRMHLAMIRKWNGIIRAIYKHDNDIFDWIFENKPIDTKKLNDLILMASLSNNVHVLQRILSLHPCFSSHNSNFLFYTCISRADIFGFSSFIRILVDYLGEENYKNFINNNKMKNLCIYKCDDIEIFKKTCPNEDDFLLFINLFESNSTSIFKYCYKQTENASLLEYFIKFAIKNENEEIFKFLFDQIKTSIQIDQQEILCRKLLIYSTIKKCFPILKYTIENKNNEVNITQAIIKCLLISAENGYERIFDYLLKLQPDCENQFLVDELKNKFLIIVQSRNINIIKSVMKLINDEKYLKMIIFDAFVDESNMLLKEECRSTHLNAKESALFSVPNVTEFLISQLDKVIPEFLLAATIADSIEAVKAIVSRNSSYNFLNRVVNQIGNALIIACRIRSLKIVRFLLNECPEIDPNIQVFFHRDNYTPLMISFANRSIEIIREIIEFYQSRNKDFHTENESSTGNNQCAKEIQKALSMVTETSANGEFEGLLSTLITFDGININEIVCNNCPFLYGIASDNLITLVNLALSLPNVDPNVCNCCTKETPLMKAILANQKKVIDALLSHKNIDINFESFDHKTALSVAVSSKNYEVAKLLIQNEKLEINLNYLSCLNSAILDDSEEFIELLLSRDECNVNEIIPKLNKNALHNNNNNDNQADITENCIKMNFDILEGKFKQHSYSILQSAVQKENMNVINSIMNHPRFNLEKKNLKLALFESVRIGNIEIYELLRDQYLKLDDAESDILHLRDLNNNSLIVVASAANNVRLLESIDKPKQDATSPTSISQNQLAFIVAPSTIMMKLIIEKLAGVDLDLPMENGSNYLTALIDFYYKKEGQTSNNYYYERNNKKASLKQQIIIEKMKFILANSNLKLTTKDNHYCSFISKVASRIQCSDFLPLTMAVYKVAITNEETKINPLHFIACNLPLVSLMNENSAMNSTAKFSENEFGLLVNQILDNNNVTLCLFNKYNESLRNCRINFNDLANSLDELKQTPIIKAVLSLNLYFASFLFYNCSVDVDIVDVFGNTVLDYLLMISGILHANPYMASENKINDWRKIRENKEETNIDLCKLILKNLIKCFVNFDCNLICMIIIKLSTYLEAPKKLDKAT